MSLKSIVLVGFIVFQAFAQSPRGEISGLVRDATGAPVAGAEVRVSEERTGQVVTASTSVTGDYRVPLLPTGVYTVAVAHPGFKLAERTGLDLSTLQNLRVDLRLEVGAVQEKVVVTAEAPLVDTRSAAQSTLIDDRRVGELPLNGRNAIDLVNLSPGVSYVSSSVANSFAQQRVRVNGNRETMTTVTLDGGSQYYAHRGRGLEMPNADAIQEFRVTSAGVSAEYGRGSVVISAVTKSGTNQLHGSLYDYLRNDALDARVATALTKQKLRFQQLGGTLGGPIRRDRTFFFGAWQGLRSRQDDIQVVGRILTATERTGQFSQTINDPSTGKPFADNKIPTSSLDPVAVAVMNRWVPLPNVGSNGFTSQVSNPNNSDQVIAKLDHLVSDANRLSYRAFFEYNRGMVNFPEKSTLPGYSPTPNSFLMQTHTLEDLHTVTPNLVNTARVSLTRFYYEESNPTRLTLLDLGGTNFRHAGGPVTLPAITAGNIVLSPGRDRQRTSTTLEVSENLTWNRGRHQMKFGGDLMTNRFYYPDNFNTGGTFNFDGSKTGLNLADFLVGTARTYTQQSPFLLHLGSHVGGLFVQDSVRVSRRLTLSVGLRWERFGTWKEAQGKQTAYVAGAQSTRFPTAPAGVVFPGDAAFPYQARNRNPGPRVGLAWDLFGDGRTAIRTSYGISYEPLTGEMGGGEAMPSPFGASVSVTSNVLLRAPFANAADNPFPYAVNSGTAVFLKPLVIPKSFDAALRNPYVQNYTFGVQQQVGNGWMVDVAYVGNRGVHQVLMRQLNPGLYGTGATAGNLDQRRLLNPWLKANPVYGSIGQLYSDGNSNYNSLQVQLVRRFSAGFTLNLAYTFAKGMDEGGGSDNFANVTQQTAPQNVFDRRAEYGLSDNDRRHRLVASWLYGLPSPRGPALLQRVAGGWEFGGIGTIQSGQPFNVTSGKDNSLTGIGYDRPNVNGAFTVVDGYHLGTKYFDTSVFSTNAAGTFGNLGRNAFIGPGEVTWNAFLSKAFAVRERHNVQLKLAMFNALNRVNLTNPTANFNNANFGYVLKCGDPRQLQVSLRYTF